MLDCKTQYVDDFGDIDPEVKTIAYSRSYLHHLFKQNEPLECRQSLAVLRRCVPRLAACARPCLVTCVA